MSASRAIGMAETHALSTNEQDNAKPVSNDFLTSISALAAIFHGSHVGIEISQMKLLKALR